MSSNNRDPIKKSPMSWLRKHVRSSYHALFYQRRHGDQQATANRLGLLSGLIVAGISVGFSAMGAWRVLELQSYNLLHQTRRELAGTPAWSDDIVVIAIDERSVQQLGHFPWPRQTYADLLNQLTDAQPATVAFEIFLPDTTDADQPLAESIINSANVVLPVGNSQGQYIDVAPTIADLAEGFFLRGAADSPTDEDGVSRELRLYGEQGTPSLSIAAIQVYAQTMSETTQAIAAIAPNKTSILPYSSLLHRLFTSSNNADSNTTNAIQTSAKAEQLTISNIAQAVRQPVSQASYLLDSSTSLTFESPSQPSSASPPPQHLLQDLLPKDNVWIKWPGEINPPKSSSEEAYGPSELQVYSYTDVVSGQIDNSLFQNKIVLVGSTLIGENTLRTPFHQATPTSSVYLYAAAINNLLDSSFLRRPTHWQELLLLGLLAIGGTHALRLQGVCRRLGMVVSFPLLWSALAYTGFLAGWWLPVAAPIGTFMLSALAVQLREQQEKQQLMALFSMNVSPGTAELIWRHKGQVLDRGELSAQNLTATVLFMDIRGFTSIAETLPSGQLLPWLNQYFETMTDCIMEHGGMVDKYIGDAIMAVFGAPVPRTHPEEIQADAIAALQTAVEMHGRLVRLNRQLAAQNLPIISFGIGIHTGPLVAGTVGNRHRLNYSLFGDTVNVAARIESMTKTITDSFPFKVLVSASTAEQTQNHFSLQRVQCAQLRGRREYTEVYTLIDEDMSASTSHKLSPSKVTAIRRPPSVAVAHRRAS